MAEVRIPYPFIVEQVEDEDGGLYWFAEVPDLPGCCADGDTPEELVEMLAEAIKAWTNDAKERGQPVPEPSRTEKFSGRVVLRMPPSLHRRLSLMAKRNRVSLNTQILNALYYNVGQESAPRWSSAFVFIENPVQVTATSEVPPALLQRLRTYSHTEVTAWQPK